MNKTNRPAKKKKPSTVRWLLTVVFILAAATVIYLVLFGPVADSRGINAGKSNILVITLDTTRADHIGAYGHKTAQTPNIDRLAREGVLFENCYTPVPLTLPAHVSLFTGMYPIGHGVRDNGAFFLAPRHQTLAESLKKKNYRTFAAIASFVLLSKFGLDQGFDLYNDALQADQVITHLGSEINAEAVYRKFNKWFSREYHTSEQTVASPQIPFFAWIHFYDPHTPYAPPEEFKGRFPDTLQGKYDGELAYTDYYIGKIIDDLAAAKMLNNTLVIIIGDHGEAFGEHNEFGHSFFCYQENIRIPLIFYSPSLLEKPRRVSNRVNLVDVVPTLAGMFGLQSLGNAHGKSLVPLLRGEQQKKERVFYVESMHGKEEMGWAPLMGIISDEYKYISLPQPELYNLKNDANEKENLFWKQNRLAKQMDDKLMKLVRVYADRNSDSRRQVTAADQNQLKSLGYISAFTGKGMKALDPKKGILVKNSFKEIETFADSDDEEILRNTEKRLLELARKNPDAMIPQYFGLLNTIYKKLDLPEKMVENWKTAIKTFPSNEFVKVNLAFQYFKMKRMDLAEQLGQQIIKANPAVTQVQVLLARIREQRNQPAAALPFYENAIRSEPSNISLRIGYAKILGQLHQFKPAWQECQPLLADPALLKNTGIKARLGIVLTEIRRDDDARRLLKAVVKEDAAHADAWNYLGILHYRAKEFKLALAAYLKAIELDPNIAKAHNNLGTLYLTRAIQDRDSQLLNKAVATFDKALKLEPRLASALNGRASAYKFSNRIPEAIRDWKCAIEAKPDFIDAYFNIAVTLLQVNDKKNALNYLNRCKEQFYNKLPPPARNRLDRLISSAQ